MFALYVPALTCVVVVVVVVVVGVVVVVVGVVVVVVGVVVVVVSSHLLSFSRSLGRLVGWLVGWWSAGHPFRFPHTRTVNGLHDIRNCSALSAEFRFLTEPASEPLQSIVLPGAVPDKPKLTEDDKANIRAPRGPRNALSILDLAYVLCVACGVAHRGRRCALAVCFGFALPNCPVCLD